VLQKGESLAVTGASGAGKSTLLNIMGTLEPPTQGVVRFEEHDLLDMEETELCRLRNRTWGLCSSFTICFRNSTPWRTPDAGSDCANEQKRGRGPGGES